MRDGMHDGRHDEAKDGPVGPLVDADVAALEAAIERESARVGVNWETAAPALHTLAQAGPPEATDEGFEIVLGLDLTAMLATLRALPDGAGTAAFLGEFERRAGG